jgi:phytoene dehydrogenase-like protein
MNDDATIIGSGPNGLSAAIVLARQGLNVTVFEAEPTIGGGARSAELTLPGFVHDVCSAILPFAVASPFFRTVPLAERGVTWIQPPVMLAHPLDGGRSVTLCRSINDTAAGLDRDGASYRRLFGSVVDAWPQLESFVLAPLAWPSHPFAVARFGRQAMRPADAVLKSVFERPEARALFAGIAAHGMLPLDQRPSAAFGLVLGALAHTNGWPIVRGGTQMLSNALAGELTLLRGRVLTSAPVSSLAEVPNSRVILCDLSPKPLLRVVGSRFPQSYRKKLERYRYGMGTFKIDWALSRPIPWSSAECGQAGTVHVGGTWQEIARSEHEISQGRVADRPFVILSQPSLFDDSRAPQGRHTAWGYCHVPNGSAEHMVERIEAQVERFAPGFRECILSRSVMGPAALEQHNANLVGGDIAAGETNLWQLFRRPTWRAYSTPVKGLYICSASTPPGVGVHGMCGYFAATRALADLRAR